MCDVLCFVFRYPAGFVYIFMALYYITDLGRNVLLGQYIYVLFYIVTVLLVFNIYRKVCKVSLQYNTRCVSRQVTDYHLIVNKAPHFVR